MDRAIEWFVAVTSMIVGASHVVRPDDWVEAYGVLHRAGRPGALAHGALHLIPGAAIAAGHAVWSWPGCLLTAFGWLLILKGSVCVLAPDLALASMGRAPSRAGFIVGGVVLMVVGAWAGYCLWAGARQV